MTIDDLKKITQQIVADSQQLSIAYTSERNVPVNYACIFAQNENEYKEMIEVAGQWGSVVQETAMGPVFLIPALITAAGILRLLKIRRPDPKRPERGDADFTIVDYNLFKNKYLGKPGFSIIKRAEMEMIELIDQSYDVLAYYSYPTLLNILKINE